MKKEKVKNSKKKNFVAFKNLKTYKGNPKRKG
jgi:hypothetical protein